MRLPITPRPVLVNFHKIVQTTQRAMHPGHAVFPLNIHGEVVPTSATRPASPTISASLTFPAIPKSGDQASVHRITPFANYAIVDSPAQYLEERGKDENVVEKSLGVMQPEELAHIVSELQDPQTSWERQKTLFSVLHYGSKEESRDRLPDAPAPGATVYALVDTPFFSPLADVGKVLGQL